MAAGKAAGMCTARQPGHDQLRQATLHCARISVRLRAPRTAGLSVAKAHVPYAMMMLLDVLRAFPGQVCAFEFTPS